MGEYAYRFLDQKETGISSINILANRYKFDAKKLKGMGIWKQEVTCQLNGNQSAIPFFVAYKTEVQFILIIFLVLVGSLMISLYYYYRTKILKNHLKELRNNYGKIKRSWKSLKSNCVMLKNAPKKLTN